MALYESICSRDRYSDDDSDDDDDDDDDGECGIMRVLYQSTYDLVNNNLI